MTSLQPVLMLGGYDLQAYPRGRILAQGLAAQGIAVEQFLPKGFGSALRMAVRLSQGNFSVIIATGKPALIVAWLTKWIHKRNIVFDTFISDFDTLVLDRAQIAATSLRAKFLWWLDRFACRRADFNILDTLEHVEYFVDEFGLARESFGVVPLGADEQIFAPRPTLPNATGQHFLVHFHGTYIPLQGIDQIIKAAKLLSTTHIRFRLVGDGQQRKQMEALAVQLAVANIEFVGSQSQTAVAQLMAEADVCLGIFGITGKAQRVIANKCYEALAMGKPLITGQSAATTRMLGNAALLVSCGDPQALANAILTLKRDPQLRKEIGARGRKLFVTQFSTSSIGKQLVQYLIPLWAVESKELLTHPQPAKVRLVIRQKAAADTYPRSAAEIRTDAVPQADHVPEEQTVSEPDDIVMETEEQTAATIPPDEEEMVSRPTRITNIKSNVKPISDSMRKPSARSDPAADPKFLQKLDLLFDQARKRQPKPKKPKESLLAHSPFPLPKKVVRAAPRPIRRKHPHRVRKKQVRKKRGRKRR